MAAGPGPIKQIDIARDCGFSPSTLSRIVNSLSDWGYLFRTSEKYVVRNFRLERNVPMSESYLDKLDSTMRALSSSLGVSAEVVVVTGHELLWHSKTDYPDPEVLIRANVGFRRSLYELDVLAQLYLSRLAWQEVRAQFYVDGFFDTVRHRGQPNPSLPVAKVKKLLDSVREKTFVTDLIGNHMGIRRFATVVQDQEGKFLHLLALAEPAQGNCTDIKKYQDALLKARNELTELVYKESAANRLRPQVHALPLTGG